MSTRIPRRLAAIAILAVGATVLVSFPPPPPTIAQSSFTPTAINAALCEKGAATASFLYFGNNRQADATLVAQCKALVAWRNAAVTSPGGSFQSTSPLAMWGMRRADNTYVHFFDWPGVARDWTTPDRVRGLNAAHQAGKVIWEDNPNYDATDPDETDPPYRGHFLAYRTLFPKGTKTASEKINGPTPSLSLDGPAAGEDDTLFDSMQYITIEGYSLTGSFPAWIYRLRNLKDVAVAGNQLSGSINGQAFLTTSLHTFRANANLFSGSLPDFKLNKNTGNANLVTFRLAGNSFSGSIPNSYQQITDGRGMVDLSFGYNNLTGDIPSWLEDIKWRTPGSGTAPGWDVDTFPGTARYRLDFAGNRLCLPEQYKTGTLTLLQTDGNPASVRVSLQGNICPRNENINPALIPERVSGISWSTNGGTLTVTWKAIAAHNATTRYTIELDFSQFFHDQDDLAQPERCGLTVIGGTPDANGYLTASISAATNPIPGTTRSKCGTRHDDTSPVTFDPTKYTASVKVAATSGSAVFIGKPSGVPGWHILTVHTANNIASIGRVLGEENSTIYSWDTSYQRFLSHRTGASNTPSVSRGDALVVKGRPNPEVLKTAGVGAAGYDANNDPPTFANLVSISMTQGWNLLSAGGDSTKGNKPDALFFIDDSLLDCDGPAGVIAVMRYDSTREGWSVALPCHPSVESSLLDDPRGFYKPIPTLNKYDNLYIYFASPIPVNIGWDGCTSKYVAAAAARPACPTPPPADPSS